jgi:hypothetical protein
MSRLRVSLRFDPTGAAKLSLSMLDYMRRFNRQRAYDLVRREFQRSGITEVELAARLGKPKDAVVRLLSSPKNWDLDTVSDMLYAISGAVPGYVATYPFSDREQQSPDQRCASGAAAEQAAAPDDPANQTLVEHGFIIQKSEPLDSARSRSGLLHLVSAALRAMRIWS